jgi:hypothetical protein
MAVSEKVNLVGRAHLGPSHLGTRETMKLVRAPRERLPHRRCPLG